MHEHVELELLCFSSHSEHGSFVMGKDLGLKSKGRFTILCGTFRRISQLWDNAHTLNLESYLPYLSSTISQFSDFIRCTVLDFIFY